MGLTFEEDNLKFRGIRIYKVHANDFKDILVVTEAIHENDKDSKVIYDHAEG